MPCMRNCWRSAIEALPDDARTELIEAKFPVIWVGDQRFAVGEFFHHFYDDHAADVRGLAYRSFIAELTRRSIVSSV